MRLNQGGTGEPSNSRAVLDFNWACNDPIDKRWELDREGSQGCSAPLAAVQT